MVMMMELSSSKRGRGMQLQAEDVDTLTVKGNLRALVVKFRRAERDVVGSIIDL